MVKKKYSFDYKLFSHYNNLTENYEIILNNIKNTCNDIDSFT